MANWPNFVILAIEGTVFKILTLLFNSRPCKPSLKAICKFAIEMGVP